MNPCYFNRYFHKVFFRTSLFDTRRQLIVKPAIIRRCAGATNGKYWTRTSDTLINSQVLLPTELNSHYVRLLFFYSVKKAFRLNHILRFLFRRTEESILSNSTWHELYITQHHVLRQVSICIKSYAH